MSRTTRRYSAKIDRWKTEVKDFIGGRNKNSMDLYGCPHWDDRGIRWINSFGRDGRSTSCIYYDGWKEQVIGDRRRYWKRKLHVDRRRNEDRKKIQEGLDT